MAFKIEKYASAVASFLLFAAAFVFWGFVREGCLLYQEWFQLFQLTPEYFGALSVIPGGFAAWCSRFLMQFFHIGWAGGLVCALVLTGIQLLTYFLSGHRSLAAYALSFLPAGAFWVALCAEDAFIVPSVSALLALAFASCADILLRGAGGRAAVAVRLVLTLLVWFLCGPFAVIFVAGLFLRDGRKAYVTAAIQLLLLALCPLVFSSFCHYTFEGLALGVFYSKNPLIHPTVSFLAAALTLAVSVAGHFRLTDNRIASAGIFVVAGILTGLGAADRSNFRLDTLMEYGGMVDTRRWNTLADRFASDPVSFEDVHLVSGENGPQWCVNDGYTLRYSCAALAWAKHNVLLDKLFTHFCPGPEGLFPKYEKDNHLKNVFASDVHYFLAMTSQSQELMFDSMETIPDFQKGVRAYRRLACTNSINGNYAVSLKYRDVLANTLFCSSFASSFDDDSPELSSLRQLRYRGRSYPINYDMLESELVDLVRQNPENRMAGQYLVALVLLNRDLQYLNQVISLVYSGDSEGSASDILQQAYMLWLVSRDDFDGKVPPFISAQNVRTGQAFMAEYEKLGQMPDKKAQSFIKTLRKEYGGTYYFYYYLQ